MEITQDELEAAQRIAAMMKRNSREIKPRRDTLASFERKIAAGIALSEDHARQYRIVKEAIRDLDEYQAAHDARRKAAYGY
jgi:hypothetical protein